MKKLLLSAALFATAALLSLNVSAAEAASDPPPPLCDPIAMAGGILIYRCLPDEGPSFLINQLGFMLVED